MTVLIFVSTDCPISNRYAPEIKRLHDEFTPQRRPLPAGLSESARYTRPPSARTSQEYGYPHIAQRDRDHTLVKMAGATITPEAAVFDSTRAPRLSRPHRRPLRRARPGASRRDAARSQKCADSPCRREHHLAGPHTGRGLLHCRHEALTNFRGSGSWVPVPGFQFQGSSSEVRGAPESASGSSS